MKKLFFGYTYIAIFPNVNIIHNLWRKTGCTYVVLNYYDLLDKINEL